MVRRIVDPSALRGGLEALRVERTADPMELGFSDVIVPVHIVTPGATVGRMAFDRVVRMSALGSNVIWVVGPGQKWVLHGINITWVAGNRTLDWIGAGMGPGVTPAIILARPAHDTATWWRDVRGVALGPGMEIRVVFSGGTADGNWEFMVLYELFV